ncbi:unnamed protein product [Diamesa serratosioi]
MNPYELNQPEIETLVQCPYNKAHQILQSRFQKHLTKCKNSYTKNDMAICCYNTTHIFNKSEIKAHEANCSGRLTIEQFMYDEKPSCSNSRPAEAKANVENKPCWNGNDEECWDECNYKTYNPKLYIQNNPVIQNIQHGLKSDRKKERLAEKARLDEIERKNHEENNPPQKSYTSGGYTDNSFMNGANSAKKRK